MVYAFAVLFCLARQCFQWLNGGCNSACFPLFVLGSIWEALSLIAASIIQSLCTLFRAAKRNLGFGIFEPNAFAFLIGSQIPALVRAF